MTMQVLLPASPATTSITTSARTFRVMFKYIYTLTGTLIAEYCYDAWGNLVKLMDANGAVLSSGTNYTVAMTNPFRYRGYYYDSETGFYYLNSRYYDPQVGRFINADGIIGANQDLAGYNLFAYCSNNPVNYDDPSGYKKYTKGYGSFGYGSFAAAMDTDGDGEVDLTDPEPCDPTITSENYIDEGELLAAIEPEPVCNAIDQCFVAGTLVSTEDGNKPIEEIKAGDLVWSENPETGEKALKRVVQTFINETDVLVHVFIGEQEIITTEEHPFWVEGKGWTGAAELKIGDIVRTNNNQKLLVCKLYVEKLSSPVKVYNFEVEDFHTYYVGDDSILVHNDCDIKYGGSAAIKMNNPSDIYHSFPTLFDQYIIPPAFSANYSTVKIAGTINGTDGYYVYGFQNGICTHRCFE